MKIFSRFAKSMHANVAIMFGLAAIPMITAGGMAIDYMGAARAQSELQQAVDNAALAAGAGDDVSQSELETLVRNYLTRNRAGEMLNEVTNISVTKSADDSIQVTVEGNFKPNFMGLIGYDRLGIKASATVKRGFGNLELALVLDNTGSMNTGGKLDSLKNSAGILVRELYENKNSSTELKIGIVPFSKYINVGLANRNALWLDVPDDSSVVKTRNVYGKVPGSERNCGTRTSSSTDDGVTVTNTYYRCDYDWQVTGTQNYTVSSTWRGCVGSRNYPLNVEDRDPAVKISGLMNISCARPITRLTDSRTIIETEINALTATGETYLPGGLMWGWRMLSNAAPLQEATSYNTMSNTGYTKAIVLMSDGVNTQVPTYPAHTGDGGNPSTTNALTASLCENIKNSGSNDKERIKIYAVTFTVTDPVVKNLLKNCATDDSYYFDAANQSALAAAFKTIGKSLVNLSLAR